jgi:hypothetical protein
MAGAVITTRTRHVGTRSLMQNNELTIIVGPVIHGLCPILPLFYCCGKDILMWRPFLWLTFFYISINIYSKVCLDVNLPLHADTPAKVLIMRCST